MTFKFEGAPRRSAALRPVKFMLFALVAASAMFLAAGTSQASVGSPATECSNAFGPGHVGFKIEESEFSLDGTYKDPSTGFVVKISGTDASLKTFNYESNWPVNVIVKGGPAAGTFYSPPASSGKGLHPPVNPNNGKYYGISHVTFCWKPSTPPPPPPPAGEPKLKITKVADSPVVYENGDVTFKITVRNDGTAASEKTVITDKVPDGLTITSADSPCTIEAQVVTCSIGTIEAGESRSYKISTTANPLPTVTGVEDTLDIGKVEEHVSLQAGETRKVQLTCGPGGIMTDAAIRVDAVDQGTGDLNSVEVRRIESISPDTYEAEVTNHATGQAQVKFFGVCVSNKTQGGRKLNVSEPVTETIKVDAGLATVDLTCPAGTTPVSPGYVLDGTRGMLLTSAPVGSDTRRFTFLIEQDGSAATASMRCLDNRTSEVDGSSSELIFEPISRTVTVGPGETVSESLTCEVGYKGIVAGWEYPEGVVPLGNDPQPITRVFKFWNSTKEPQKVTLHLLCLNLKTGSADPQPEKIVNTATVSSITPQASGAVLADSASVTVKTGSPAPVIFRTTFTGGALILDTTGITGPASLAVRSLNRVGKGAGSIRAGAVIGRRTVAPGSSTIVVRLKPRAAKAIRSGSLKRVRINLNTRDGSTTRAFRLKR
jgi:uncharacterized repeat protein (TIGR01451 family)